MRMQILDIITKKKLGQPLTREEITFFARGAADKTIPDYQLAALLMAIRLNGMTAQETTDLTLAMRDSGDVCDLSAIPGKKIDKHSTGGVGDTTTLILAPLVAACGVPVAKMSGRGLGHTGGTLDKLESIPGLSVEETEERFIRQVQEIGLAVIGQTAALAPADKTLYALRDVTSTVDSLPLIAASIMSKKLASGADGIVLDVKTGSGALMETLPDALALAQTMVDIGKLAGKPVVAVITSMAQPLGTHIGNALEVKDAIDVLAGRTQGDLLEISLLLGSHMLVLAEKAKTLPEARAMLEYGFAGYQMFSAVGEGEALNMSVPVRLGGRDSVSVVSGGDCGLLIKKGGQGDISLEAALVESVHAPVCEGDVLGEIRVKQGERIVAIVPAVAGETVQLPGMIDALIRIRDHFMLKAT